MTYAKRGDYLGNKEVMKHVHILMKHCEKLDKKYTIQHLHNYKLEL